MITQEMVEVALQADMGKRIWLQARSTSYAPADKAKMQMEAALTAVYPLIRNQVLEEAAKVCEKNYVFHANLQMNLQATGARQCAIEIRNLKDKTDEAHNG